MPKSSLLKIFFRDENNGDSQWLGITFANRYFVQVSYLFMNNLCLVAILLNYNQTNQTNQTKFLLSTYSSLWKQPGCIL